MEYKEFEHESLEENLRAAKQAVRTVRNAFLMRHTDMGADVIDVVRGKEILERHICKKYRPYTPGSNARRFCIEEMALYR